MNMRLAEGSAKTASGRLFCRPEAINVNPLVHEENLFRPRSAKSPSSATAAA